MKQYSGGRLAVMIGLVFCLGILAGAGLTLWIEIAKVRQVVIAQLEGKPAAAGASRMAKGVTRLVARELKLSAGQADKLEKSLGAHKQEIQAARLSVSAMVQSIAREVYGEIRPDLNDLQRAKAEAILH